jgi:hypothetical protein
MTALKYYDGTTWVTLPDNTNKQIWTGPDAPVPLGDNRLWIDTDEPDPTLVGANSWHSTNYATSTASVAGWKVTPIEADANFVKNGDAAAFVRNADGSLTVRDAGVYNVTASLSLAANGGALISKGVDETVSVVANLLSQSGAHSGGLSQLAWVGYLPAGQIISLISYCAAASPRQTLSFSIARILSGLQGPPGPPGPIATGYACAITGNVSIPATSAGAVAKMALNTVVQDSAGWWNVSSSRYEPKVAGRYLATAGFVATIVGTGSGMCDLAVVKNGSPSTVMGITRVPMPPASYGVEMQVHGQFVMNGTTDYLELWGGATTLVNGQERMEIAYLGTA